MITIKEQKGKPQTRSHRLLEHIYPIKYHIQNIQKNKQINKEKIENHILKMSKINLSTSQKRLSELFTTYKRVLNISSD